MTKELILWGPFCPLDQPGGKYIHVIYPDPARGEIPFNSYCNYRSALERAMKELGL